MINWGLEATTNYLRAYKKYDKKHKNELKSVLAKLHNYYQTLKDLGSPQHINGKYIHREPNGIKALDESGERKMKNLQVTRLYIYPDMEEKVLYLLTIGNKKSQKNDIKLCVELVRNLRRE